VPTTTTTTTIADAAERRTGAEPAKAETPGDEALVDDDEVLIEEVSIDGMCGVY
jgi:mycofactocin precursor